MSRFFIAVWPPESIRCALVAIPRNEAAGLRWTIEDQWHITLRYLGDVTEDDARAALASVEAAPAEATLGPAVIRLAPGILVVPIEGLDDVAAAVLEASRGLGEAPHPDGFRGHLSLARSHAGTVTTADRTAIGGSFPVEEIALVRSDLRSEGARYTTVAVQPLSG